MKKPSASSIGPFFLGPKSENEYFVREKIQSTLDHWFQWRKSLFTDDPAIVDISDQESESFKLGAAKITEALETLNNLLKAETPKYTPRYIGHMVSETSLPAILGHFSALLHNPNNTITETARVGAVLEEQGINMLLELIGYDVKKGCGHFTSGGTVANFEAMWRARFRMDHWLSMALCLSINEGRTFRAFEDSLMGWDNFRALSANSLLDGVEMRDYSLNASSPWRVSSLIAQQTGESFLGPVLLVPSNKHFSWQKGCNLMGLGEEALWSIPLDDSGKLDCKALQTLIERAHQLKRPILMVVSVAGTTEMADIDPVNKVQDLLDELKEKHGWDIWHHIDAAYGGFMCALTHHPELASEILGQGQLEALTAIRRSHSVTMDPHKLGYIPYSCGAFLVPDEQNYTVSGFRAPYLDRPDLESDKWSSTIEGSRAASGAAATWLTGKTLDFSSKEFAGIIGSTITACGKFKDEAEKRCSWFHSLEPVETNILCFSLSEIGDSLTKSNKLTEAVYKKIVDGPNFSVSKTILSTKDYQGLIRSHVGKYKGALDQDQMFLIRCVFMNPFWSNPKIGKKLRQEFIDELTEFYNTASESM